MKCFSVNSCDKWLFIAHFLLTLLFPVTAAETVNCHYFHTGFLDASQLFILNAFPRCFAWFCFVFFLLPRLNIVIITSYYNPMCCGMCLLNVTSLAGITRCFIGWHMALVGNAELDTGTLSLRWEDTGLLAREHVVHMQHNILASAWCWKKPVQFLHHIWDAVNQNKDIYIMCIMSYNVFF